MTDTDLQDIERYSLVVKQAIQNVIHDNSMSKNDKVDTIYATPPIAFAKYSERIVNGEKAGPLVTFYLTSIDLQIDQQMNGYGFLNVSSGYKIRAPQIYKLTYTATINCIKESQGDLLQTQLLLSMPFNHPYAVKTAGQWATLTASSPQNLSSVDAGNDKDKISRRQVTIEIPRAYLDYDYSTFDPDKLQKKIILRLNSLEGVK